MSEAWSYLLTLGLVLHAGAHVAITLSLLRRRQWTKAALAFGLPPLAPLYAWRSGLRGRAYVWAGGLAIYALGVML